MALQSWPSGSIHIHTDSTFVLCLVKGSLLTLKHDGWPSFPWLCDPINIHGHIQMSSLFQHLLYLLCSHSGHIDFSWTCAHANDPFNIEADFLANKGCTEGPPLWLDDLVTPDGWVDAYPILNYQPLSTLPAMVIEYTVSPCDDIAYFSFIFFIFPFHSVLLFPLHSAPSPTHNPPIFQYFIDCRCALHFLAPLCRQM